MADNKYVFFVGNQRAMTRNKTRVVVRLAYHSRSALNTWGLLKFIGQAVKEISEVALIEFDPDPEGQIVDVTLKGTFEDLPDSTAMTKLGLEVAQKLDKLVVPIVDGKK